MDTCEDIFEVAKSLPEDERVAYVEDACADTAERKEVLKLLADAYFDPLVARARPDRTPEGPGTVIGPYTLIEKLGEGGFGTVWVAERSEPKLRVALKVIKLGMDTEDVIARFEAERQALARMNHPGIARIMDAGSTPEGRPCFVMELVEGVPITQFCDERRLGIKARLELFMDVCAAVQHAHQKGIIHRDLKPCNILVSEQDGKPVAKVIDFGIAQATEPERSDETVFQTLFTRFEQFMGTPAYMSPEQASGGSTGTDTRSDIYSLGVVLYELLTGQTPFDSKELLRAGFDEMRRVIRENEPPRASTRFGTLSVADCEDLAARRRAAPAQIQKMVRGDLDWIVMKAMEKECDRRYETANALRRDIERFVSDKPVTAAAPSRLYRFHKFARRNRGAFAAGVTVGVALLGATAVSTIQAVRAKNATGKALAALDEKDVALAAKAQALAQTKDARRAEAQAVSRAQTEIGNVWMERANYYKDKPGQQFYAALMASRAIGFETSGRDQQDVDFMNVNPVWFKRGTRGYERAAELARLHGQGPRPVWSSPISSHHLGDIGAVAYSPDGRLLASAGGDGIIAIWDARDGQLLANIPTKAKPIHILVFSPDGKNLASVSDAGHSIKLWSVERGEEHATFSGHKDHVHGVAFSPDGKMLASAGHDKTVVLWDLESYNLLETWTIAPDAVSSLNFDRGGDILTAIQAQGHVDILTIADGGRSVGSTLELTEISQNITQEHATRFTAFSEDGRIFAAAGKSIIKVFDRDSGDEESLRVDAQGITCLALSPDGKTVAAGSRDRTVRVWDIGRESEPKAVAHTTLAPASLAFRPDGKRLAIGSRRGVLRQWDMEGIEPFAPSTGHQRSVRSVAYSPDGRLVASASADGTLKLWDLASGELLRSIAAHRDGVGSIAFSPDGSVIASRGQSGHAIKFWGAQRGVLLKNYDGLIPGQDLAKPLRDLVFSPDGTKLATAHGGAVAIWDLKSDEEQVICQLNSGIGALAFSPDGETLAIGGRGELRLWTLEDGVANDVPLPESASTIRCLAFSPDGKALAFGDEDGTVRSTKLSMLRWEPTVFGKHKGAVHALVFSPDGSRLVTGGHDGSLLLWNLTGKESPTTLWRSAYPFYSVACSPDGRMIATGGGDCTLKLWDISMLDRIRQFSAGGAGGAQCYALSLDGRTLATAETGRIKLWDLVNGGDQTPLHGYPAYVDQLALNSDGTLLAGTKKGLLIELWDLENNENKRVLTPPHDTDEKVDGVFEAIAFSPDDRWLAGTGEGGTCLWDLARGGECRQLDRGASGSICLAFSPDSAILALGNGVITLHQLDGGGAPRILGDQPGLRSLAFHPDGNTLATGISSGKILLWDFEGNGGFGLLGSQSTAVTSLAFSPDGTTLATSGEAITLWDLGNDSGTTAILGGGPLAFGDGGRVLVGHDRNGAVREWVLNEMPSPVDNDLASYYSQMWITMNGREISWPATLNELGDERSFDFLNVPGASHIALLQRNDSTAALFSRYSRVNNWNAALLTFRSLPSGAAQVQAAERLVRWFESDFHRRNITVGLVAFRLQQLHDLFDEFRFSFEGRERIAALLERSVRKFEAQFVVEHATPEWRMLGRSPSRNRVGIGKNLAVEVNPGTLNEETKEIVLSNSENVRWAVKIGSQSYGDPAVAFGKVFIGTNNQSPRDPNITGDRGILMCFDEETGEFLWQLIVPKLAARKVSDWEYVGICSTPAIEDDRLWVVTNRGEVVCLDIDGLADGNDGPFKDEADFMTDKAVGPGREPVVPELTDRHADILWVFDMREELGVLPHNVSANSPLVVGDLVYVGTSNGVDWSHTNIPAPDAPALVALDKRTGELAGEEFSGISKRTFHAAWSSPALGHSFEESILLWCGGDGFAYGFDPEPKSSLLVERWRYDANPPNYRHKPDGSKVKYATYRGPSEIIASPVFHDGLVYVAIGQDPEHGDGLGMLSCINPGMKGDLSGRAVWTYDGIGRTISAPSVADGLLYIAEYDGDVHCLDSRTGDLFWIHETGSRVWASTLVADDKVYLGTEDGEVVILEAGKELKQLGAIKLHAPIYNDAVIANNTLYVATQTHLYALAKEE